MLGTRLLPTGPGTFVLTISANRLCLFNGQNGDGVYAIGAASFDGATWTEYGSNPVLTAGASGAWDDDHVKDPCLLHDGSQYVMYYSGHDGTKYQIGRATASSHEGPWTKYASNPVLTAGAGGAFDDAGVIFPTILYEPTDTGREWKMWYGANDGSEYSIGYAYSSDGLSWTKHGQVLTKGASTTWEDVGVVAAAIYNDAGTYNLFYAGYQDPTVPKWQGGIATFTDPEGTYTKDAGNPILRARFNDAGVSQTPSGATSGATQITVTDTTVYNVGEMVVLADVDSQYGVHRVVSLDSSTLLTLTPALAHNYTSGSPAFRPLAEVSTQPRSVLAASGGGYEMFGTPFQALEDLTVGGTKLIEGALRWTAAALDDQWAYDYDTGLLFDLYPATTGWHQFSAENPSVIVTP